MGTILCLHLSQYGSTHHAYALTTQKDISLRKESKLLIELVSLPLWKNFKTP